ncbi:MAG: nucleotide pyrophosphohydrolase [Gemmatimonadales bacterium]|nr:MAG: nucleotide pyrophosphohydrolase [Gemmatimonadales bacterium]
MELKEAQSRVDAWIGQFEEGYWPPLVNLARLTEEVGELARLMNHRFGPKRKKPGEEAQDLGEELADVLFVLVVIANQQGIDLADALDGVLEKYRLRDSHRWTRKDPGGEEPDSLSARPGTDTEAGVDP